MNQRYNYLLKNTGILTLSNFSSKILVFLLVPLYTSVLSTEEYGFYDLSITTIQLLWPILTMNILDSVMRFCMSLKYDQKDVISIGCKYTGISIAVFGVILIINHYFHIWPAIEEYSLLIFLYFLSYILNQLGIQVSRGLEHIQDLAIAGVIGTVITIIFNLLLLIVYPTYLKGFYIANILGQMVPALFLLYRIRINRYVGYYIKPQLQKEMLLYSIPLIMVSFSWWANSALNRYIVTFMCGIAVNGLYSVSYKIPSIINTVQSIFMQAWQISAIREYDSKDSKRFYQDAFLYLNAVMSLTCTILILLTKSIAHVLYAKDFYQAWQFVPFLLVSSVFNTASGFVGQILSAAKASSAMAKSAIYGISANIIMNFIFIFFLGAQGAAIATTISSYIIFYKRKNTIGNVLQSDDYWRVNLSWVLLCFQSGLMIYSKYITLQIILVIIISFTYLKPIIYLLKKLKK